MDRVELPELMPEYIERGVTAKGRSTVPTGASSLAVAESRVTSSTMPGWPARSVGRTTSCSLPTTSPRRMARLGLLPTDAQTPPSSRVSRYHRQ